VRYVIVNADDFGATSGITRGIIEAHRTGIVTSASLLVDYPGSEAAAAIAREMPSLAVGLHVDLTGSAEHDVTAELERQLDRFIDLMKMPPTHLDSHHNVHWSAYRQPAFAAAAHKYGMPLRGFSAIHYVRHFYGRWSGEAHLEQIGVAGLLRILESELRDGLNELACHPGYVDADLRSEYAAEREVEVRTLCDPSLPATLRERGIQLAGFRDASCLEVAQTI
jgi:predicted glycoside hydrolase/deacetylase ChbG (UPF0249 family)